MKKRSFFFFLAIILIGGGSFIYKNLPSLSNKIAPKAEWPKIIIGKWKYNYKLENSREQTEMEGEIEFLENNEFKLTTDIEFYGEILYGSGHLFRLTASSGKLTGQWNFIDNKYFKLNTIKGFINNYFLDPNAENKYAINDRGYFEGFEFGIISDSTCDMKINSFNSDNLLFTGKDYTKNGTITFSLDKIED
jgi:hypothetical protein